MLTQQDKEVLHLLQAVRGTEKSCADQKMYPRPEISKIQSLKCASPIHPVSWHPSSISLILQCLLRSMETKKGALLPQNSSKKRENASSLTFSSWRLKEVARGFQLRVLISHLNSRATFLSTSMQKEAYIFFRQVIGNQSHSSSPTVLPFIRQWKGNEKEECWKTEYLTDQPQIALFGTASGNRQVFAMKIRGQMRWPLYPPSCFCYWKSSEG